MNFPLYMASRLRLTSAGKKANTTGLTIAVAGVALALMVMEITLAVVTGFKHGITRKLMGFESQVVVQPPYSYDTSTQARYICLSPELSEVIGEEIPDASVSLKISMPGLLKTDSDFAGVYFVGHDSAHDFSFERSCLTKGSFPDFNSDEAKNSIVISQPTASALGLDTGDRINVCFFVNDAVKLRRFDIAGIYESGFEEYDATVAFASLATLQRISSVDSLSGTQIDISGLSVKQTPASAERLQLRLLSDYQANRSDQIFPVDNVTHTGATYLSWLSLLDTNVAVIFILMLCVAGFTLVSSMFILILERIPTIGILRAMGATRRQVREIFIFMAMKVVGIGMLIGNVLALCLLWIQNQYHIVPLDARMYYLDSVPVEISPWAVACLNVGVAVAAWLILILPSIMAAKVSPALSVKFD